jgi:putative transposase
MAFPLLAWLALGPPDRETGNHHRLAPQGLSPLLDLEEPTSERPTVCTPRDPESDPQDESCQSTLGRAPHTRRVAQAGIEVSQGTVAQYMVRHRKPPSQSWRTFPKNHVKDLASTDFFVVPTATFRLLFVFVVLSHNRRRPVHFGVTSHPTAEWTAQKLMAAFPWDSAPRYLLRDRDGNYGKPFRKAADWMDIHEVLTAPQSPWQNAYVERFIGSIRRECLDHVIVISEAGLRRVLKTYFDYYDRSRTHLALGKDAPAHRAIQPPALGEVIEIPQVGGLHHRYERRAA